MLSSIPMQGRLVTRRGVGNALAAALVLVTFGCVPRKTGREAHGGDSSTAHAPALENPAEVLHPCPPQPSGPPIGKSDPLMNAAAPKLSEWVTMWRAALPGFEADSMWGGGRERWLPASTQHFERISDLISDRGIAFDILGLRSPDGRYILDVDSYMGITPGADSLDYGGEPESRTVLIDPFAKTETVVDFCGTPCGFHWGAWLSPTSFALAYWHDADDSGQWEQGRLSIYSLSDSMAASYRTRIISTDDALRYRTAWERWLMKRYRALKASRPRA